ncbi:FG-GAP repeat domain-containing protein [Syntrophus sp. (in: bacteria)]|uniref:FG-GAP repeat domain-containing protein n=1 Tax=Syntrophus sp. (in: bacteria) TaxID=48412 RepID=UPI00345E66FA
MKKCRRVIVFVLLSFLGAGMLWAETGDFNKDGRSDLLLRYDSTGKTVLWFMNADGTRSSSKTIFTDTNASVIGIGDFNKDGITDLIRRKASSGQTTIWFMNADGTRKSYKIIFTDMNATVVRTGDFQQGRHL